MANDNRPAESVDVRGVGATKTNGAARPGKPQTKPTRPVGAQPAARTNAPPKRQDRRAEMIQKRREERLTVYERRRKEWLYTRIGLGALAALVLLGLGWGAYSVYDRWRDEQDLEGVVDYEYAGLNHIEPGASFDYTESPPVGGQHDPAWQNCGFYDRQVRSEHAVHSLEHGAVWITYRPDLPPEDIEVLREKTDGEAYLLVSPYPDLPAPVVASSWNHQIVLDGVDDGRLDTFIRVYLQGPDTPEPGALCSGRISTTV